MAASFNSRIVKSVNRFLFSASNYGHTVRVPLTWCRNVSFTKVLRQEEQLENTEEVEDGKPKRKVVDVETSIRYLDSKAFVEGYGDKPIWFHYRRNFKGNIMPQTRKKCIRKGENATASPCPVCRDEYLILDAKNTKLLEQFISPHTGDIFDTMKTGLCQEQQRKLTVEVMRAWDQGYLEMKVPFRTYNYDDYKS